MVFSFVIASTEVDTLPLAFMHCLSPTVAYLDPGHHPPASTDPDLILMFLWMGALDEHIAKYIAKNRALFPTSRILLLRSPLSPIYLPGICWRDIAPALPILRILARDGEAGNNDRRPRVFVQIFSNGGVDTFTHVTKMLMTGPDSGIQALPRYVLFMDSCAGYLRWRNKLRELLWTIPWWASPVMPMVVVAVYVHHVLCRMTASRNLNPHALLAPQLAARECRRTYLYGTGDDMVDYRDIEDNAAKAEQGGFAVRRERFDGAKHRRIAMEEPERYWRIIRETWDGTCP